MTTLQLSPAAIRAELEAGRARLYARERARAHVDQARTLHRVALGARREGALSTASILRLLRDEQLIAARAWISSTDTEVADGTARP